MLALFETARLSADQLTSESIAFQIGPRLNAAGRMGNPADSLRLLTTRSPEEAAMLAEKLEELNRERRAATEDASALAEEAVQAMPSLPPILVVAHDGDSAGRGRPGCLAPGRTLPASGGGALGQRRAGCGLGSQHTGIQHR